MLFGSELFATMLQVATGKIEINLGGGSVRLHMEMECTELTIQSDI